MNSAIEFVDGPPSEDPNGERRDSRRQLFAGWAGRALGAGFDRNAAVVAWLIAAASAVVATFQTVFTYRFDGVGIHTRGGFAASGRSLDPILSSEHGPRYAELFAICAVWFLAVAVLVVVEAKGRLHRLVARHVTAIAGAGTFLLAGSVAALGLDLEATHSSYTNLADDLGGAEHIAFRWHTGACLWWVLGAVATALVALAATSRIPPPSTTEPPEPDPVLVDTVVPQSAGDPAASKRDDLRAGALEAPEEELVLRRRARGSR